MSQYRLRMGENEPFVENYRLKIKKDMFKIKKLPNFRQGQMLLLSEPEKFVLQQ